MKNLTLVFAVVLLTVGITEAQVKRQYRNAESSKTVMVIKEKNTQSTDIDILNQQFDLDKVSMSDEIKITTDDPFPIVVKKSEAEVPSTPEAPVVAKTTAEAPIAEQPVQAEVATIAEQPVKEVKEVEPKAAPIAQAKPVAQKVSNPTAKAETSTAKSTSRTSTAAVSKRSSASRTSGSSVNRASFKKKKKSKRVRLKKRKKPSRRKFSSCYKF